MWGGRPVDVAVGLVRGRLDLEFRGRANAEGGEGRLGGVPAPPVPGLPTATGWVVGGVVAIVTAVAVPFRKDDGVGSPVLERGRDAGGPVVGGEGTVGVR